MMLSLSFILGALVGSFLNCIIHRLEVNEGFIKGRSYCPHCKETIGAMDLIPIISFLFLKGRCRHCDGKISLQYPIVEIATGIIFAIIVFYQLNEGLLETTYLLAIFSLMIVMFVYDLKHYLIPDEVVFSAIGASLVWHGALFLSGAMSSSEVIIFLLSGIGSAGFFWLLFIMSKGAWLGFGDVKLALFMGLFLGYPGILVALFSSFTSGAIIGSAMVFLKKKEIRDEIPFAPFLIFGTTLAFFWGEPILNWYFNILSINAFNI